MFPKSLRGYVERALARCKDDTQMAACQVVMKEVSFRSYAMPTVLSYVNVYALNPKLCMTLGFFVAALATIM